MRVYVAYKYSNVPDKDRVEYQLKKMDEHLAPNHEVFILMKNYYNWDPTHKAIHKSMYKMFTEIRNSDALLFIIDTPEMSWGMLTEELIAKFLGKKRYYYINGELTVNKPNSYIYTDFDYDLHNFQLQ